MKSGTDFRYFSLVTLDWAEGSKEPSTSVEKDKITSEFEENEEMKQRCEEHVGNLDCLLQSEIGHIGCDLDGRIQSWT